MSEATAGQSLWAACGSWLHRAEDVIGASAEALNSLNVFPVPDADTGSNLRLTLRGIVEAVPVVDHLHLDDLVQAAVLSAHGNSGAILAEMVTSVCRALEQSPVGSSPPPGVLLARLLRLVATAATRAVAQPVAGTILTVADATAGAAEDAAVATPASALTVAEAGQQGAREALRRTPDQLDVLAAAGVVDAGGQAFVLFVDVLVEVLGGAKAQPLLEVASPAAPAVIQAYVPGSARRPAATQYEVMYALRGATRPSLDRLRAKLSELGHSVVIVGDQSVAQVHVHLEEPGPAVEAALDLGRLSQLRISALDPVPGPPPRAVVSVVAGDGLAEAVRALGGVPVQSARGELTLAELSSVLDHTCGDVVILPNDMENLEIANHLAARMQTSGRRLAVIPTVAQVQGLAAVAVHEPTMGFAATVAAMSAAADHTRHGAVTIAETAAMTLAGRCRSGDVLGVVDGDFVEIGTSVVQVAMRVVHRLLGGGGELVTLVTGLDADSGLAGELERRIREEAEAVDVEIVSGGQPRYLVLIGVE